MYEVKAELWEWLEKKLNEIDNASNRNPEATLGMNNTTTVLEKKPDSYVPRIVDIYFGYTEYDDLKQLREIRGLEKGFISLRKKLKFAKKGEIELYMALQKVI